jgi:serine/threonine-protein kinase ULK/ATG1
MPKAVDIYVLEKKIGSGQFGDVFKGYSKIDNTEVAIKTINRNKIKGISNDIVR